jgi:hypothetical protein
MAAENLTLNAKDSKQSSAKGSIDFKPNPYLEVTLTEALPFNHGEINESKPEYDSALKTRQGAVNATSTKTALSVRAKWLSRGQGNRITPPNVRRGERLLIHRLGSTDQYFWETIETDNHLRKLETAIWVFSATKDESVEIDFDSCYFVEVSTHEKRIRIGTSMADGEPYRYTIDLDTKFGKLTMTDDIDNFILMESKPKRILLRNADNSFVHMADTRMHFNADDEILITTKKYTIQASESMTEETATKKTDASSGITNTTPTIKDNANVEVSGTVKHGGVTTLNGMIGQ